MSYGLDAELDGPPRAEPAPALASLDTAAQPQPAAGGGGLAGELGLPPPTASNLQPLQPLANLQPLASSGATALAGLEQRGGGGGYDGGRGYDSRGQPEIIDDDDGGVVGGYSAGESSQLLRVLQPDAPCPAPNAHSCPAGLINSHLNHCAPSNLRMPVNEYRSG